jgi:hypothetical protein
MRQDIIKAFTPSIEAWRHGGGSCSFIEKAEREMSALKNYTLITSRFRFSP